MYISKKSALFIIIYIGVFLGLGISVKVYFDQLNPSETVAQQETEVAGTGSVIPDDSDVDEYLRRVGSHILLPNELPRIVSITDVDELKKTEALFQFASNGDKLLIFSKKVILYNPRDDVVIDIAHIVPGSTATSSAAAVSEVDGLSE